MLNTNGNIKSKILLFLSMVLFYDLGYSQNVYVEFGFGAGIPLPPYSSTGAVDVGNAKTAAQGNVSIAYRLNEGISMGLKGIFMQNKQDGPIGPVGPFVSLLPWAVNTLLLQGELSQKIGPKVFFNLSAGPGIMFARFPNASERISFRTVTRDNRNGSGFALGGGAGFRFYTADNFALTTNMYLLTAKPEINEDAYFLSQRINVLFLNVGVILEIK